MRSDPHRMKIRPKDRDLANWSRCPSRAGDLLFFGPRDKKLAESLLVPVMTVEEVRAQAMVLWTLHDRSWYGYALGRASYCAWLTTGALDELDPLIRKEIGRAQIKLGVPSLISSRLISAAYRTSFLQVESRRWVTSRAWTRMPFKARVEVMRAWMSQNEIHAYSSATLPELPVLAKEELVKSGMASRLHRYAPVSGPNCFAATAAAVARVPGVADHWLHWAPFKNFLKGLDFLKLRSKIPVCGDALVFFRKGHAVHAAYYLGEGVYFEKPGQDFYEPYRIARFEEWAEEWPETRLEIWRRRP